MKTNAFKKGGTAALLVMSPFQLLCAIEAINEFKIDKYRIVLFLNKEYEYRNEQLIEMTKKIVSDFDVLYSSEVSLKDFFNRNGIFKVASKSKYDRVFIGDYMSKHLKAASFLYCKRGSKVLMLDDGSSSIVILKGATTYKRIYNILSIYRLWKYNRYQHAENKRMLYMFKSIGAELTNCYFTIYNEIRTKKFLLYPNRLTVLKSHITQVDNTLNMVCIIGTIVDQFAIDVLGISVESMENIMIEELKCIITRHSETEIVYVPHPCDNNARVMEFCITNEIKYNKLNTTVEDYLLTYNGNINAIYGFGSTAMGVLKKCLPDTFMSNISIESKCMGAGYKAIYDYYRQIGISVKRILVC